MMMVRDRLVEEAKQCDQTTTFFLQYLNICKTENLPRSIERGQCRFIIFTNAKFNLNTWPKTFLKIT